jgi:probable HAF family extracellular repeat protein
MKYSIQNLRTLGGDLSRAYSINDAGLVVGESHDKGGQVHAFVWSRNTGMPPISTSVP